MGLLRTQGPNYSSSHMWFLLLFYITPPKSPTNSVSEKQCSSAMAQTLHHSSLENLQHHPCHSQQAWAWRLHSFLFHFIIFRYRPTENSCLIDQRHLQAKFPSYAETAELLTTRRELHSSDLMVAVSTKHWLWVSRMCLAWAAKLRRKSTHIQERV